MRKLVQFDQNFDFGIRRDDQSVDDKSLSYNISQNSTKNKVPSITGSMLLKYKFKIIQYNLLAIEFCNLLSVLFKYCLLFIEDKPNFFNDCRK